MVWYIEKKSTELLSSPHVGGCRVVPSPHDAYDVSVLLGIAEWNKRADLLQLDWTISEVESDESDEVIAADAFLDNHELHYRNGAWVAVECEDATERVRRETLARYIQSVWDGMPRDGDEAALLEALLNRDDSVDRRSPNWKMADEIAKRLGIPNIRSYQIITEWDFWECGVSARAGWFSDVSAARKRLSELTAGSK